MLCEKPIAVFVTEILELTEAILAILLTEDPDPDKLRDTLARRQSSFVAMQKQIVETGIDKTFQPQVLHQLLNLDEQCIRLASAHKKRLIGLLSDANQYRQVLGTYGLSAGSGQVRGWYVDRKDT